MRENTYASGILTTAPVSYTHLFLNSSRSLTTSLPKNVVPFSRVCLLYTSNFPYGTFGGGVSQNGNNYKYRMTFKTTKLGNSTTQSPTINDIRFYGDKAWASPNDMVKGDYPFSWDRDMNCLLYTSRCV